MSDSYTDSDLVGDEESVQQPAAAPSPMLQSFREAHDAPGIADEARDLAHDQTVLLNDYFQRRDLADASARAGEDFVANIDQFKSGLVSMVQKDPHAAGVAMDLADLTLDRMVSTLPNIDDPASHSQALIQHTQSEIAVAAITSMAEQDAGAARGMLADERIMGLLGANVAPLETYISMQEGARARDDAGHAVRLARAAEEAADLSARNYLGALHDPNTGAVRLPDGWNQGVISDMLVPPRTKVDLIAAQDRLMTSGDTPTNPLAAMDIIGRLARGEATQRDLYPMIGAGMSLKDANLLSAVARNPAYLGQLSNTLDTAAQVIAPNGSIAESRALGRFTSALLGQVARGAILDPLHPDQIMNNPGMQVDAFRVQGNDLIDYEQLASTRSTVAAAVRNEKAVRRSLGSIFSGDTEWKTYNPAEDDDEPEPRGPLRTGARGPFYGVEVPSPSQRVGVGSQRINADDPEPTEVRTDTGTKQLTAADLARAGSGPRPMVTEAQQAAFDSGGNAKRPSGRPRVSVAPRRRKR